MPLLGRIRYFIVTNTLILALLNPDMTCLANSADPVKKPADLDLHDLSIYINNLDQII